MDRCRIQIVGAAPIARDVLEFFLDLDIPIYEIYGMSESSGPQTVSFDGTLVCSHANEKRIHLCVHSVYFHY